MVSTMIKPRNSPSLPHVSKPYTPQSHESVVNQSIEALLDARDSNMSESINLLYEVIQAQFDPILESVWVYSALTYRGFASSEPTFLDRISSVKNLFQLISACSAPCSGASKSIALLAPVVFKVHALVVELWEEWSGSKRERKMLREVRSLVDIILGYISLCCSKDLNDPSGSNRLIRPLKDLVSLWMETDGSGDVNGGLSSFFPLASDAVVVVLNQENLEVGELAGAVVAQLFLMRMCLSLRNVTVKDELLKELKDWVVTSITGMHNVYLFEMLLQTLLEPVLPVTSLLNSEDELILRNALYDAVLLVDYSFLDLDRATYSQPIFVHVKNIALMRIIVAFEATELFRRKSDHSKAISISNAFSSSRLPSQLFRMIARGFELKGVKLTGSSPKAYLKWILDLERQGLQIFPESLSRFQHKFLDLPRLEINFSDDDDDEDVEYFIDKVGEEQSEDEDNDQVLDGVSDAFMAAAQSMTLAETKKEKKRKSDQKVESRKKKLMRSLKDSINNSGDDTDEYVSGCSDGDNGSILSSDEDMEETEQ